MSMTAKFYTFDKRRNSTKTPTIAGLTSEDLLVVLKSPTSYKNPSMHVERSGGFPFNYMDWSGWLYWIDDVVSVGNDRYEIRCSMDVLGTLRPWILNTTAFVLYDQTANSEIPDTRLSTKTVRGFASNYGEFQTLGNYNDPGAALIILSIIGQHGLSYWAITQAQAFDLMDYVYSTSIDDMFPYIIVDGEDTDEILESFGTGLARAITTFARRFASSGSAPKCITGAMQIPIASTGALHGNSGKIWLGEFDTDITGFEIDRRSIVDFTTITIPWTFSDWRRRAPYTELYLYCPYFGMVALPTEDIIGQTGIYIETIIDAPTGAAIFEVSTVPANHYIGSYSANLGGQYAIGASGIMPTVQGTAMIGATIAGAAIIATGGSAGAMAAKIGGAAVAGIIGGNTPAVSCVSGGGGGAAIGLRKRCYIFEVTHDTTVAPSSVSASIGTPAMAQKSLGGLTGYVQTKAASVSAPFYEGILNEVNAALDGGVFIE